MTRKNKVDIEIAAGLSTILDWIPHGKQVEEFDPGGGWKIYRNEMDG